MAGSNFPIAVRAATLLACVVLPSACGGTTPPPPPPVHVTVDGAPHDVERGTTFGTLIDELGLHATTGRLLSVLGQVLDRYADPGRITLNGRRPTMSVRLHDGDRISVLNGEDRTESTRSVVVDVGLRVANPERTLTVYPTRERTVSGRISGEVVSITEEPLGAGTPPRAVALTFDDGPWPVHTHRLLAVLRNYHVEATFFMVGRLAERYPGLVQEVMSQGHEIGNHSFDHPASPALADLPSDQIASEIAEANTGLAADGVTPTLFRPPGGSYDDFVVQEARRQGMRVVLWSVDPRDWRPGVTAKVVAHRVVSKVRPGSIVLLHDGGGDAVHTIKALPMIIRGIRQEGLRFVTIPAGPV